jgi:hypothetical protein
LLAGSRLATTRKDRMTKLGNQSCIRWTDADRRLILSLQRKSGIQSVSDLIRQALRALADKEAVKVTA